MGNITWTKSWSASDNGTVLGGADIQNIQNDITTVVNGGISNANINATAAIAESKIAFNTSSGHDHDGSDSKLISLGDQTKHYRKGLTLYGDDDDNICVMPGVIEIEGTFYRATAASGDLAIATAGNWAYGSATNSTWVYVYVYNNSGSIGYKFSTEPPDLSDEDDATAEYPLRYQKYSTTYYRCIGCVFIDAAGDLCWGQANAEGLYFSNFDASNKVIVGGRGTGSDQTINTIWTPKQVWLVNSLADTTPATTENTQQYDVTQQMLSGLTLNSEHSGGSTRWLAITTAYSINAITEQAAGTAGAFTIDAGTDNTYWYAVAETDIL